MTNLSDEDRDNLKMFRWLVRYWGTVGILAVGLYALHETFGWMWQQP